MRRRFARTVAVPTTYRRAEWDGVRVEPHGIRIRRAAPMTVDDGTLPFEIHTTAQTVGEALRAEEITIYLGRCGSAEPGQRGHARHARFHPA